MATDIARVRKDMGEVQGHAKRTADVAEGAARMFKAAFAGLSVAYLAKEFISLADASTAMGSKLKLATRSSEEYNEAQKNIYNIAQKMRVPLDSVTTLYARMSDPVRKLGGNTRHTSAITEAFSSALIVSGATTAEASSATIQFSQAMASGTLRGEEFNSVNEAAPRVMQALEASLGKTRGELREMAEQGKLTSDVVANALIAQFVALKVEAESMPLTIGGAITQLRNDVLLFAGDLNETTGATSGLAQIIGTVSDLLRVMSGAIGLSSGSMTDSKAKTEALDAVLWGIAKVFEIVTVAVRAAYEILTQFGLALSFVAAAAVAMATGDFAAIPSMFEAWREKSNESSDGLKRFSESVLGTADKLQAQREALRENTISTSENAAELTKLARQSGLTSDALKGQTAETVVAAEAAKAAAAAAKEHEKETAKFTGSLQDQLTKLQESNATFGLGEAAVEAYRAKKLGLTAQTQALREAIEAERAELERKTEVDKAAKEWAEFLAKAKQENIDATLKESEAIAEQVIALEEETLKMGMSREELRNLERARLDAAIATARQRLEVAIANGVRAEELDGITMTVEELQKLRDAKEAGWAKEAAIQARDAAQDTGREWAKTVQSIEDGLTDSLMRAFESGKGFMDAFKGTLVNAFKTMVLQPTIRAIMAPVTAGIGSLFGSGSAMAGQGGGFSLSNLGSMLGSSGGLSGLMSIANGSLIGGLQTQLLGLGDFLATSSSDLLAGAGEFLQSNYAGLGSAAGAFGGFMAGRGLGQLIGNGYAISGSGNGVVNAGAALGTLFGGPIGGAIGGAIGGVANRLFGRKLKDSGIEGTLSTEGISGNAFEFYKGGIFRSNKTKRSDLDPALDSVFDAGLMAASAQVASFVDVLGLPVKALEGYSEQIKISFKDLSEEEIRQAIADSITKFQGGLASLYSSAIAQYQKSGETALETLQRLAQLEGFSRVLNEFGGVFSNISTLGIDARESLIAMAGGMDALLAKTQQFVGEYYTQQEQAALSARGIFEALSATGLNLAGLDTKAEYRALLENRDLTTDQGRAQFTALLNASSAFAQLVPYLEETGNTLYSLLQLAPAMKELEALFAPGTNADGTASGLELGLSDVSSAVTSSGDSVVSAIEQLRADLNNGLAAVAGNTNQSATYLRDLYEDRVEFGA